MPNYGEEAAIRHNADPNEALSQTRKAVLGERGCHRKQAGQGTAKTRLRIHSNSYFQQQRPRKEAWLRMRSKGIARDCVYPSARRRAAFPACRSQQNREWISTRCLERESESARANPRMRTTTRGFARCPTRALGGIIPLVGKKHACAEVSTRNGRVRTADMRRSGRDGGSAGSSRRRRSAVFVCRTDGRPGGARRRRRGRWRRPPWSRSCPAWKQS